MKGKENNQVKAEVVKHTDKEIGRRFYDGRLSRKKQIRIYQASGRVSGFKEIENNFAIDNGMR